ncbi:hypothetical protein JQ824_07805 [Brachyspira hyodysenteriae]|uniref:Uncharacterized protein n=1 Tax=Brachyspira hyodysenteriae (strain ATCC 49526 / WA1) TaxID=565034 RepID=A0A3B6VDP3_BRAHW|nr:hypothetical protein [Brachyspira hyodysenteriae]ACN84363.1 hypothetical protein BHWA1_01900 [Brachyspira hyodysenteriae WA1]KLI22102.1 hypothetical protein SU46_00120 [Brachyspira hyodysenteriae]KLI45075.1 hypothetical protein SZ53_02295 [Brachyspira hyodysenteriae]KLI47793.1 hypothetical protein SZ41_08540 [Brachyspira hyodysenteriae]KLI51257.1 hypothetical protein SZ43_12200 [Brachyspira hyodysenteriae]
MNISVYIENLKIENYYLKEKEIKISPITIFSKKDFNLVNLIWYINNFRFFDFYKINDYELLSISKIISAIMENYKYNGSIDNDTILECIDFLNNILEFSKKEIVSKIFKEHSNTDIEKIYLKLNYDAEINISSYFESDNIINIIFMYKQKSFSSKIFFSRKIDIFFTVIENIFKILINNNILNTLYISDFQNIDLVNANKKDMPEMDFIFKLNEISQKENIQNINNKLDLIKTFMKYYNHNIMIEYFEDEELLNIISNNINKRNFLLVSDNIENLNNLISNIQSNK